MMHRILSILFFVAIPTATSIAKAAEEYVYYQNPVLTSFVFVELGPGMPEDEFNEKLTETAELILRLNAFVRRDIRDYAILHSVSGKLEFTHREITWEGLRRAGDAEGMRHFVRVFVGATEDLSPFVERVACPKPPSKTVCLLSLSIFETEVRDPEQAAFEAAEKAPLLRDFMRDVAATTPRKFVLSFQNKIELEVSRGQVLENETTYSLKLREYRSFDDEKSNRSSSILPASTRGREFIYDVSHSDSSGWISAENARFFDVWLTENMAFPATFKGVHSQFGWDFYRFREREVFVLDHPIQNFLGNVDDATLKRAFELFEHNEDVVVDLFISLKEIDRSTLDIYLRGLAEHQRDRYSPVIAYFVNVDRVQVRSTETDSRMDLPLPPPQ